MLTSCCHSHRVIPVKLKLLKFSYETLWTDSQAKEMCKAKLSLSKQSKMWCSPRYFFLNFSRLFPLSALTCGSRSSPATECASNWSHNCCSSELFLSQNWLFPFCPLFSEGRAGTKLKYLTICGFRGWLKAEVSTAFLWWMKKWWNECWTEWLRENFSVASCARECVDKCTKCVNHSHCFCFILFRDQMEHQDQ